MNHNPSIAIIRRALSALALRFPFHSSYRVACQEASLVSGVKDGLIVYRIFRAQASPIVTLPLPRSYPLASASVVQDTEYAPSHFYGARD